MKFTVYVEDFKSFREAVRSNCTGIRFGTEFCEWKIPHIQKVQEAYALAVENNKEFTYVTPRLTTDELIRIDDHLKLLNRISIGRTKIVVNDFGIVNILHSSGYTNLYPHLGIQLISVPLRGRPPLAGVLKREGMIARFAAKKLFQKTNLNCESTVAFFRRIDVTGVDIDWLPGCFSQLNFVAQKGFDISLHVKLSLITITRSCHTARYLGEKEPEKCSRPCLRKAFLLEHSLMGNMYLQGNTLFGVSEPTKEDAKFVRRSRATEMIISMMPITRMWNKEQLNVFIDKLSGWFQ